MADCVAKKIPASSGWLDAGRIGAMVRGLDSGRRQCPRVKDLYMSEVRKKYQSQWVLTLVFYCAMLVKLVLVRLNVSRSCRLGP